MTRKNSIALRKKDHQNVVDEDRRKRERYVELQKKREEKRKLKEKLEAEANAAASEAPALVDASVQASALPVAAAPVAPTPVVSASSLMVDDTPQAKLRKKRVKISRSLAHKLKKQKHSLKNSLPDD